MPPSSRKSSTRLWRLRDEQGRLRGPLTLEQMHQQIDAGRFHGAEMISEEPGGRWIPISTAPEFSDRLLDALAIEAEPVEVDRKLPLAFVGKIEATEVLPPNTIPAAGSSFENTDPSFAPVLPDEVTPVEMRTRAIVVREISDLDQSDRSVLANSAKLPVILIAVAACLIIGGYFFAPVRSNQRFHLLAPRSHQPPLEAKRATQALAIGLVAFESDTFSGYVRAQNQFVQVVEGAPQSPESYSALCLSYRELWTYSAQDSRDLRTLTVVAAEARRIDPTGPHGAICEIARLQMTGRYPEARGLVETWARNVEGAAPLLEIQGGAALAAKEYQSAEFYFASARSLQSRWLKPYVQEARARTARHDFIGAAELLRRVTRINSAHQIARIELGILEQREFKHDDKAIELLLGGLNGRDRVPPLEASSGYAALAQSYSARGQKSKALDAARRAYAINKSNLIARDLIVSLGGEAGLNSKDVGSQDRLFLVDQYMQSGDYLAAQAAAKAAFDQDPRLAVAAMKAGECLWKLNQSSDAIEWMKKAIGADPYLTLAYVELSSYFADRYDYVSATAVLKKIQALQPRSHEVYRGLASVELKQNNFKVAVQFADRALSLYDSDAETFLLVAKARLGMGEYVEAQKYVGRAIEMDGGSAEGKCVNAKIIAGLKGAEEAIRYAKGLIVNYPYVGEYRLVLAEIYAHEDRYEDSLVAYNEMLSIVKDKQDKRLLLGRGKALQALGKNSDALDSFLQAAVIDPTDALAIYLAGGVYFDQAKFKQAIDQYKRVLRINPRYPRAHAKIGRALLRTADFDGALKEAEEEKANNPHLPDAHELAAEARYALHDYAGCAQEYQKAVAAGGVHGGVFGATTYVALARCYRLSGSFDSAVSILHRAEALESGLPSLYKEYGAAYHMKGMADEAVKAYNTYLSLAPNAADRSVVQAARDRAARGDYDLDDAI